LFFLVVRLGYAASLLKLHRTVRLGRLAGRGAWTPAPTTRPPARGWHGPAGLSECVSRSVAIACLWETFGRPVKDLASAFVEVEAARVRLIVIGR
jgi:hypothetical protein